MSYGDLYFVRSSWIVDISLLLFAYFLILQYIMKRLYVLSLQGITIALSACNQQKSSTLQNIDTTLHITDTISTRKTLNDIRFKDWDRSDWLDNEYIRTLRKYLDDYNSGKVCNANLDPYKEQIKGQFVIYDITPYLLGGVFIRITFLDMPNRVFSSWIYSEVNEDKEIVESYEFRSISIEEETTDMTKEDILQAIKEMDGIKLW